MTDTTGTPRPGTPDASGSGTSDASPADTTGTPRSRGRGPSS